MEKTYKTSWIAMVTFMSAVTTAPAKYTNRPLNGYVCSGNFYDNLTDISQHQCVHRCLSNGQCATLSYNPVSHYCLLGFEPCPSATLHPEFMLMVFRETERRDCIFWIPRNNDTTTDRVFTAMVGNPFRLGRLSEGDNQIPGFAKPGILYITDLILNQRRTVSEYDILVVSPSCSLAWLPYRSGDSLPEGSQQTGIMNGVAVYSIMVPDHKKGIQRFGLYVVGEVVGHYSFRGDIHTTTDMYILVHV